MWIEGIFIESFGGARGAVLQDLGPGLTVIVGPNDAGKSTIVDFVRSVFFGFRKKSGRANIYEPPGGIPRSGWLVVRDASHGKFYVHRSEKRSSREGRLAISDENGSPLDEWAFPIFRAGLDRSVYETLFAFDLDGIRRLDQEALREKILAASLGSVAENPLEVLRKLEDDLRKIFRKGPGTESLSDVQSRLKAVDRRLRELAEKPARYSEMKDQLEAAAARRTQISAEIIGAEDALREMNRVLRYEDEWKRLLFLEEEALRLKDVQDFPADGVPRLEQALDQRQEAEEVLQDLEKGLERLAKDLSNLQPDPTFLEFADSIETLDREALSLANRPPEIEDLSEEVARSTAVLTEEIAGLGKGWNWERVASSDPSMVLEQEIRAFCGRWRVCHERVRDLQARMLESLDRCRRQEEANARVEEDIAGLAPLCGGYLDGDARLKLHQWSAQRDRIVDLSERLNEKNGRLKDLVAEGEHLTQSFIRSRGQLAGVRAPAWWWSLPVMLGAGGGAMLYAASLSTDLARLLFMVAGSCMLVAVPLIIRWRTVWDGKRRRSIRLEMESLQERQARISGDVRETEGARRAILLKILGLKRSNEQIAEDVLGNPQAGPEAVGQARKASMTADQPMRRKRILEDALRAGMAELDVEVGRKREITALLAQADGTLTQLKCEWEAFVADRCLHLGLDPDNTLALVLRLRDIKAGLQRVAQERWKLSRMTKQWQDFADRVTYLGMTMERGDDPGKSPLDLVDWWAGCVEEAGRVLTEKMAVEKRVEDLEVRIEQAKGKVQQAQGRLRDLMAAGNARDVEAFRERALLHKQCKTVQQERRVLLSTLLSGFGFEDRTQMLRQMSNQNWDEIKTRHANVESTLARLREEAEDLASRCGRLASEIELLESEDETERLLGEKEELVARLNELVKKWATLKLASILLDKTLRICESEKQPRLVERGSEIFRNITGQAYVRLLFPMDDDRIKVQRAAGQRTDEDLLSRGTLEQVYLSLRLAHLEVYHRGEAIPLIMDDVLVNFDPGRAARTAAIIADFSEATDTQVLFLTCQPGIADLFPESVPRIRLNPFDTGGGLLEEDAFIANHPKESLNSRRIYV